ncbi:Hexuronate transporter [Clostridium formicaceticum]|uniref:Hexuronate transporter n=1 Tax=Clostridium formicaceticum TaxID=1497 RepID=A0AAC9RJX1_9CLOT|nr:MFS transporter [Clostridium formicaceticum]ARE86867.1 Hexuronate transporter [Clostridium formicaceticum]
MKHVESNNAKWFYLVLMVLSFTVTFMTRFIWPPLISTVAPILNLSAAQSGAYMSAFYIGYVITQIPGGVWADKFGVKFTLSLSLLVGGLATVGMSLISVYSVGFALRLMTGLGAGSVMACCTRLIADNFDQSESGVAFGILLTGPTLGLLIANQLGAALLNSIGWQGAFRVVGIITIIIAVIVFVLVKPQEKETTSQKKITFFSGIKTFFTTRNLIGIGLSGFFYMFVALGTATWANAHLANLGFAGGEAASVMTLYSVGGIIGSIITGLIVKKFNLDQRNFLIAVYVIIAGVAITFGNQSQLGALRGIGFLFGLCSYLPNAHLNSLVLKFVNKELAASVMGVQNFMFQLASIIAPAILGWTIDITGNFNTVWYSLGASPIIGIFFLLIIKQSKQQHTNLNL